MSSTRDQIIATTCALLEGQGFHATGLNQIVRESGTPKGSLYHYFPDGKDELAAAAIARAGHTLREFVASQLAVHDHAADAIEHLVEGMAVHMEGSGCQGGGPLLTVAMETATTNQRLNHACRDAYSLLHGAFEAKLLASGYEAARARELATFAVASIEGGIVLSRTYHSGDPLRVVARHLSDLLRIAQT